MDQKQTPVFRDEGDKRLARIISIIIWATWAGFLFVIIIGFFFNDLSLMILTMVGSALLVMPLVQLRQHKLQTSSLSLVLIELGTVAFIAMIGQGIRDLALFGFPIIILFAGLVLERIYFRISVGFMLVVVFWLSFGENFGWFVPKPFEGVMSTWFYMVGMVIILLLAALAVDLLSKNMRTNLELARNEIAQRTQAEEALQKSKDLLNATGQMAQVGGWEIDLLGNTLAWTDETFRIHEFTPGSQPDVAGAINFYHPDDRERVASAVEHAITTGQPFDFEARLITMLGNQIWVRASGQSTTKQGGITSVRGSIQNITERKQAEAQILQLNTDLEQRVEERTHELHEAQEKLVRQGKLAVLGQLAGSVGHELRNPLSVINSSIYYLKLVQPEANTKIKQHLGMIEQEAHIADKIIGEMLDFARNITANRELVSIPKIVQQTLEKVPLPPAVEVVLDLPADLPNIFVDPLQMLQVMGNLTTNAFQAMVLQNSTTEGCNDCKLTITARQVIPLPGQDEQKESMMISVQDTGPGISPENMKKIFEPLFTTKVNGIGLGLVVSQKLAEANGGWIEVESELGKGSTFKLYVPVGEE